MKLAKIFQLFHWQIVAGEVQQRVNQHGAVTVGQHEAIAVGPVWISRVVLQVIIPQHFSDIGHTHRGTRVATIRFLYRIHTEGANGIGKFGTGGRHRYLQAGLLGGSPKSVGIFA